MTFEEIPRHLPAFGGLPAPRDDRRCWPLAVGRRCRRSAVG